MNLHRVKRIRGGEDFLNTSCKKQGEKIFSQAVFARTRGGVNFLKYSSAIYERDPPDDEIRNILGGSYYLKFYLDQLNRADCT